MQEETRQNDFDSKIVWLVAFHKSEIVSFSVSPLVSSDTKVLENYKCNGFPNLLNFDKFAIKIDTINIMANKNSLI